MLPEGYRLDECRIIRNLEQGGFGIAYLAEDVLLARLVAVKEFAPAALSIHSGGSIIPRSSSLLNAFGQAKRAFLDEARALAAIDHPNIVRLHRYFEHRGAAYMIMEFVDGLHIDAYLSARIAQDGLSAAPALVRDLMLETIDGVAVLHNYEILHRGLKPANVIVRRGNGRPVILTSAPARLRKRRARRHTRRRIRRLNNTSLTAWKAPGPTFTPSPPFFIKPSRGANPTAQRPARVKKLWFPQRNLPPDVFPSVFSALSTKVWGLPFQVARALLTNGAPISSPTP
ncbi:hypothetical protein CCP2SC5_190032 [Azospirillaceae bacterium]